MHGASGELFVMANGPGAFRAEAVTVNGSQRSAQVDRLTGSVYRPIV